MSSFRFSIFKQPRHQRFEYQPRYYDPVKEELDARVKQIKAENQEEYSSEYRRLKISREFAQHRKSSVLNVQKQKSKSLVRLILIVASLSYICYWILTKV